MSLLVGFVGAALFAMIILAAGPFFLGFFTESGSGGEVVRIGMIKMTIVLYSYILHIIQ